MANSSTCITGKRLAETEQTLQNVKVPKLNTLLGEANYDAGEINRKEAERYALYSPTPNNIDEELKDNLTKAHELSKSILNLDDRERFRRELVKQLNRKTFLNSEELDENQKNVALLQLKMPPTPLKSEINDENEILKNQKISFYNIFNNYENMSLGEVLRKCFMLVYLKSNIYPIEPQNGETHLENEMRNEINKKFENKENVEELKNKYIGLCLKRLHNFFFNLKVIKPYQRQKILKKGGYRPISPKIYMTLYTTSSDCECYYAKCINYFTPKKCNCSICLFN
jgi:hypothetical protein